MTGGDVVELKRSRVTVRGLSQRLQLTRDGRQAGRCKGEIVPPVLSVAGGKPSLIVGGLGRRYPKPRALGTKRAMKLGRNRLDIVGEVKAGRGLWQPLARRERQRDRRNRRGDLAQGTGSLVCRVLASNDHALSARPHWAVGGRRQSGFLFRSRRSTSPWRRRAPLVATDKPRCPDSAGEAKQPCSFGLQLDQT